ncbi:50S ribosomal protein L32 [Aerococcus suis]|uniref:Large ribosomal subunit protein bL32 n=1 Tax=Aerococcus suis TaxID=371602 RepID=A0A1W1YAZ4_9LACT|nr:50S ribosomal protein L32 [Aerococcus suis]MDD7758648.1 50S ribosomal protein L32 [Aerococcus suis]MDY4647078.1 50S ribosomal protein L32 [Aerococcus suis]SMC33313.1 LSU ribosomal protein L32P [Aerococcus suis]
MAVPKRKTSKSRKRKRMTHYKLGNAPIYKDPETGEYRRRHHVAADGTYKGRQVINKEEN